MFKTLEDFVTFAGNRRIVIADYGCRQARLRAMLQLQSDGDRSALLEKWIVVAHTRLEASKSLYEAALYANSLNMDEITDIYNKLKQLKEA